MYIVVYVLFIFLCYGAHRDLPVLSHSVPTRRSSDLDDFRRADAVEVDGRSGDALRELGERQADQRAAGVGHRVLQVQREFVVGGADRCAFGAQARDAHAQLGRSEEHTSELQSLMRISYAVFCLKKKNNIQLYST